MPRTTHDTRRMLVALALVFSLFAGQLLAASSAPAGGVSSTGRSMGQAGFAYLSGLRTFAAAVLWSRLEPLYHEYYDGRTTEQLKEFLPTMRLVQTLDPQFEQVYYNAAWILYRRDRQTEALSIARDGIANNPNSGLLHANYVQILLAMDKVKNLDEARRSAAIGLGPNATWTSGDDKYEGYAIFRTVYQLQGDQATVDSINQALAVLKTQVK